MTLGSWELRQENVQIKAFFAMHIGAYLLEDCLQAIVTLNSHNTSGPLLLHLHNARVSTPFSIGILRKGNNENTEHSFWHTGRLDKH